MIMKKLSFALAMILLCSAFAGCTSEPETTTATPSGSTTKVTTKNTPTQKPNQTTAAPVVSTPATGDDPMAPIDELADSSRFTLDGKLDDWEGLHAIVLQGEGTTANKKVSFYACVTTTGLYVAAEAYHDEYSFGKSDWWLNSNLEFFIPGEVNTVQYFVYADGMDQPCLKNNNIDQAVMVTEELTNADTKYRTVTEVFLTDLIIDDVAKFRNTIDIGIAWKTVGDLLIGGAAHVNEDGSDEYWVPVDTWPNNPHDLCATPKGLYYSDDYFPAEI